MNSVHHPIQLVPQVHPDTIFQPCRARCSILGLSLTTSLSLGQQIHPAAPLMKLSSPKSNYFPALQSQLFIFQELFSPSLHPLGSKHFHCCYHSTMLVFDNTQSWIGGTSMATATSLIKGRLRVGMWIEMASVKFNSCKQIDHKLVQLSYAHK